MHSASDPSLSNRFLLVPPLTVEEELRVFEPLARLACALFSAQAVRIAFRHAAEPVAVFRHGIDIDEDALSDFFQRVEATQDLQIWSAKQDERTTAASVGCAAGMSLKLEAENVTGIFCLMTCELHALSADAMQLFSHLHQVVLTQLSLLITRRNAARSAAAYQLLADNSTDTIVRGNLDGVRLYISPSVKKLLGYEPEELIGRKAIEIVHPDHFDEFRQLMLSVREGRLEVGVSEQRQLHKDGSWIWMEALIKMTYDPVTGEPDGYVASVRNIMARKAAEEQLMHQAAHDALTGLLNRKFLHQSLSQHISRSKRSGQPLSLLYLDLDRFKQVNDELGHQAGDIVLREAARRFRAVLRNEDILARWGGDEFVILQVAENVPYAAQRLAQRLIACMAAPIDIEGRKVAIGVSIGIATLPDGVHDAETLLNNADKALYQAKSRGRNTYAIQDSSA